MNIVRLPVTAASEPLPVETTTTEPSSEAQAAFPASETASAVAPSRQERASSFKRAADMAARAREQEKLANQKLQQVKQFEELLAKAKEDPTLLAQVIGLSPVELTTKLQNNILGLSSPPPKPLTPEEELKSLRSDFLSFKEQEEKRKQEDAKARAEQDFWQKKNDYINAKIMPAIKDPDKYELINQTADSRIEAASYVYDILNQYYCSYHKELPVEEVIAEYENALAEKVEAAIAESRKLKRFSKYFRDEPKQLEASSVKELQRETDGQYRGQTTQRDRIIRSGKTSSIPVFPSSYVRR